MFYVINLEAGVHSRMSTSSAVTYVFTSYAHLSPANALSSLLLAPALRCVKLQGLNRVG